MLEPEGKGALNSRASESMRILVACGECKRRYDASRHPVGSRFRCRCGHVLTVPAPQGHNARVVRCSSCGAARREGSLACRFCGDDFTLHERDMHTVCPECLARVSDRAKFCHNCATPLFASETVGDETTRLCPSCGDESRLHSRKLGRQELSALECDRCAGFWLSNDVFEHLARKAQRQKVSAVARREPQALSAAVSPQRSRYRPCPFCGKLMNRTNYGIRSAERGSGTIIDVCRAHGVWFDAEELSRILNWLARGGKVQPLSQPPEPTWTGDSGRRTSRPASREVWDRTDPDDSRSDLVDLVGSLLGSLFDV